MLQLPSKSRIEVGVDEAGRGPLAFDVVSAAVIMPSEYDESDELVKTIKDSKKVSAKKREKLAEYIKQHALAYGIGIATVQEIDQHNILNATYMAMHRALDQVYEKMPFTHIYVDGDRFKAYMPPAHSRVEGWIDNTCVVDGDNTYLNIAAASILAKTTRDSSVDVIVAQNPEWKERYGFHTNKGYGTAKHMQGIKTHGITQYHRKTFAPVANIIRQWDE
jgi:ribonuclease HII